MLLDLQLMIFQPQIDLRKVMRTFKLIKQVINTRKQILVLDGHLVQLLVVYTKSKTPFNFLGKQKRSFLRQGTAPDKTLL